MQTIYIAQCPHWHWYRVVISTCQRPVAAHARTNAYASTTVQHGRVPFFLLFIIAHAHGMRDSAHSLSGVRLATQLTLRNKCQSRTVGKTRNYYLHSRI